MKNMGLGWTNLTVMIENGEPHQRCFKKNREFRGVIMMTSKWNNLQEWLPLPPEGQMPAVVQDAASGAVLMLIILNQEALDQP